MTARIGPTLQVVPRQPNNLANPAALADYIESHCEYLAFWNENESGDMIPTALPIEAEWTIISALRKLAK